MSHTPGPWTATQFEPEHGSFEWLIEAAEEEICETPSSSNAALIAAAPDLLAALDGLLDMIGERALMDAHAMYADERIASAHLAIDKAEGR